VDVAIVEVGTKEIFEKVLSSREAVVGGVAVRIRTKSFDRRV
jgi:hypothetical protein